MDKDDVLNFLKDKRVQWAATAIILLVVLFMSSSIRLSNWNLLTDQTTGEKIPLALDPYYFLRMAETIVRDGGKLPPLDNMRLSPTGTAWSPELMPWAVVWMYHTANIFGDYTLQAVDVASPVIFYALGLILFFFLAYALTKSKAAGLISSGLLAFSPAYLYRTMGGFSDHEPIGMVAIFSTLLIYTLALKNFEKDWKKTTLYGIGVGFFTAFTLMAWGGAATFILMIIPLSFLIFWLLKNEDRVKAISFYSIWIISSFLFPIILGRSLMRDMIGKFSGTYGMIVFAILGFMIIDWIFEKLIKLKKLRIKKEHKILYSIGTSTVLGSIALTVIGRNIFEIIKHIWHAVLFPFGTGRVGLTVAENSQPYLVNWISQNGPVIFWLFILGIVLMGIEVGKTIKSKKHFALFTLSWALMISAMLFSRISSSSTFNGVNFISQAVYLLGVGIFAYYFIWLNMYKKFNGKKLGTSLILLIALMFIVILNGRSAVRVFFLITPFVILSVGYFTMKIFEYAMKNKEEVLRIVLWGIFLFAVGGILFTINTQHKTIASQAKYTGPGATVQWQDAMAWVRNNTAKDSIFVHWWDYGYWVQTLGERATIADGGHFEGDYNGDERIGRYVLTTANSATAYSFMKTHNVSYLLIDPSDLGKYSAYSKIGSNGSWDRFSMIPVGLSDTRDIRETSNGTIRVYKFRSVVDEDIEYKNIFLPGPSYNSYGQPSYKSFIVGVILKTSSKGNMTIAQPEAVYVYNNVQYKIPLRRVYFKGKLYNFRNGLNATLRIIPSFQQSGQRGNFNPFGAAIYLSPRTEKTLFANIYLMNDPLGNFKGISLAHSEDASVVKALKAQGVPLKDFVYFRGFRGPIKIWKINYPVGTPVYEGFLKPQKSYADMDWRFK